jgi:putative addiction module component (TIGR02574 family)
MTLDTLIHAASKLTPAERAELVDALLDLDWPDGTDASLTPAQREDLNRRIDEYRAGKAKMIPGDVAIEMLRKRA